VPNEIEITVKGRDQGAQRTISETGRSVQRVGEIAQGIIAAQLFRQIGQAASEFLGQARDASSNLGESINAVNVVFKGTSEGIHSIGETSASAMGLSQNAFNAAAVRFSNFAKVVAGPGGDAAATIRDITQRSADFASVLNLDVTKGMELFQSGLAGETEPLRRYGIDVSAAAVKTFAYANGIAAAGAELTEAEKIQARYGLIMQQTEAMAGDFANTSDSLANSQRILNAEFENAQAIVGNLMVPGLQAMNAILIPLVQTFNDAPRPVQLVIGGLVLLAAGAIQVTSAMAPMLISMNAAGISAGGLATRARAAALSMTSLGLAVAAAGVGVIAWGSSARHTSEDVAGLTEDVDRFVRTGQQTASLKRHFGEGAEGVAEFADKLDVATAGFFSWSNNLNRSFDEISKAKSAFKDLDTAMADLVDRGADSDEVMRRLVETYDLSAGQVEELRGLLPKYSEAAQRATERTGDLAGAQEGAATATGAHAASVQELADTLRAQTDPVFAFTRAQQDLAAAQDAVTEAVKDHGKKSPEYRRALQDEAEAALDVLEAAGKLGDEFTGDLSDAQRQMLRDAGLSEAGVAELERMMRIAKRRAEELDGTRIRIYELYQRTIRTINENITRNFGPSAPQVFAHGGITGAQGGGPRGGQVLVGEQGPELVDLAPGSMVHTAGATQALLGGGRGPVEIVFRIETGGHELDEAVRASMLRTLRNDPGFRADVKVSVVGNGR
jgi:exonuclease VII small subunit